MAEVTSGVRAVLSAATFYDFFQHLVGAGAFRRALVADHLAVGPRSRILDVGCGTAEILKYLPADVEYVGFDASDAYIRRAQEQFGRRGTFVRQLVSETSLDGLPGFDLVLSIGVLHHLGDADVEHLFGLAARALNPGGRLFTVDPCLAAGQHPLARAMIRGDRGQNVRDLAGYRALAERRFEQVEARTRHDLLRIPYTHALLTCSSPRASAIG